MARNWKEIWNAAAIILSGISAAGEDCGGYLDEKDVRHAIDIAIMLDDEIDRRRKLEKK